MMYLVCTRRIPAPVTRRNTTPRCPVAAGMSAGRYIISGMSRYVIRGPLTYELALKDSPIRRFFDDRLTPGLKDAQAAYRIAAGPILVPGVPREAADAGPRAAAGGGGRAGPAA
jgi:hypothetical protein